MDSNHYLPPSQEVCHIVDVNDCDAIYIASQDTTDPVLCLPHPLYSVFEDEETDLDLISIEETIRSFEEDVR